MEKQLAITCAFSEDDFQMAFLNLKRNKLLPEDYNEKSFTDGEDTIVNFSECDPSQSVEMCTALMLMKIGVQTQ
jgi:hypothetical protein